MPPSHQCHLILIPGPGVMKVKFVVGSFPAPRVNRFLWVLWFSSLCKNLLSYKIYTPNFDLIFAHTCAKIRSNRLNALLCYVNKQEKYIRFLILHN